MNADRSDNVEELIPKYLAGEASAEEEKRMTDWIAQRPENERRYSSVKKIFELSEKHYAQGADQHPEINIDAEWAHFVNQITEKDNRTLPLVPVRNSAGMWLRMAAALIILVASGVVINYIVSRNRNVQFQSAENTRTVSLPDGTNVILNVHSVLSYAPHFGEKTRTVTLQGEAFFEVAHDVQKPFIIEVQDTRVQVLGTSFNVQGYDYRNDVEVVVKTGIVSFTAPVANQAVKLVAGQKGVYSRDSQKLLSTANKDVNFLSWNTRNLMFEGSDLRTVVETLNKTYQANIVIAGDVAASCAVTVTFDHQTLEAVLRVLENTLNLTYKITGNKIEIIRAGC